MPNSKLRFLFVKTSLAFPRSSGHDVHTFFMMKALAELGHEIHLLLMDQPSDQAIEGGGLAQIHLFNNLPDESNEVGGLSYLQKKFCSYWGVPGQRVNQVARLSDKLNCDAVVVVGLDVLPYLGTVSGAKRIWYAADEWLYHHLTQVFPHRPTSWSNLKPGLIKGLYEFAYASKTDRVWVVSDADARAIRCLMPGVATDVIPNGVDTDHYCPIDVDSTPYTCTMWGRLDFGPNIDAVRWFSTKVWPKVRSKNPDAQFDVFGFQPTDEILTLAKRQNFNVIPDMPDLRDAVAQRDVVVLPFVSGAGIKNKFLEAAAMGKPIIVSRRALNGVRLPIEPPVRVAKSSDDWCRVLNSLWANNEEKRAIGQSARRWVSESYSWTAASKLAAASVTKGL